MCIRERDPSMNVEAEKGKPLLLVEDSRRSTSYTRSSRARLTATVLNLLRRSLVSTMPLSDICFCSTAGAYAPTNLETKENIHATTETETGAESESKRINTKLLLDEENNCVVYVEAGEELMNLLFSFLTLPLGSVVKLVKQNSSIVCIDNLYRSVQDLSIQYFKREECKTLLLFPKVAPFFSNRNQLLKIEEVASHGGMRCANNQCYWKNEDANSPGRCRHGAGYLGYSLHELNPKIRRQETVGGFAKRLGKFVVTDSLSFAPLTPISIIQVANDSNLPSDDLVEREDIIGEIQAVKLVRAALTSKSALTNVFCSSERKPKRSKQNI